MGKVVHLDRVRAFMAKTPVFRAKDVEAIVRNRPYARLLLHKLAARGEVRRVTRGWYTTMDDPVVSVFAFKPAYLALEEALSLHGLWEQETNVVLVTPRRVRPGLREEMGGKVVVHRISREHYFGFEYLKYGDMFVPVSDVEKTLIDLAYFGVNPGADVLERIRADAAPRKLDVYLRAYPAQFRRKVQSLLRQGEGAATGRRKRREPTSNANR